jgi:hypothetical protein
MLDEPQIKRLEFSQAVVSCSVLPTGTGSLPEKMTVRDGACAITSTTPSLARVDVAVGPGLLGSAMGSELEIKAGSAVRGLQRV